MCGPESSSFDVDLPPLAIDRSAVVLILELASRLGPLMFRHDDNGWHEQPRCARLGSLRIHDSDVKLGEVAGCEYWMSRAALRRYGRGTLLLAARHETSAAGRRFVLLSLPR